MRSSGAILLFFFVPLFFAIESHAQDIFRKGYILTNEGDTIPGKVAMEENGMNHNRCLFQKEGDIVVTSYLPFEINGYGFAAAQYYQSDLVDLGFEVIAEVFLEVLVSDETSLFQYNEEFYIRRDQSEMIKLVNEREEERINGKKKYQWAYVNQLSGFMSDCEWLINQVDNTSYHSGSLTRLVNLYNNCDAEERKSQKNSYMLSFGFYAAVHSSNLSFQTINFNVKSLEADFNPSVDIYPGLDILFGISGISKRVFLRTGLEIGADVYQSYHETESGGVIDRYDLLIERSRLTIPVGAVLYFPSRYTHPYLSMGGSVNHYTSSSGTLVQETEYDGEVVTNRDTDSFEFKKTNAGLWVAAGMDYSLSKRWRVFLEFRYQRLFDPVGNKLLRSSDMNEFSLITGVKIF